MFKKNKICRDLEKYFVEKYEISRRMYNIEMNNHIMDDNITNKGDGFINNSYIHVVDKDYIKIKIEIKKGKDCNKTLQKFILLSYLRIIKSYENKITYVYNNILIFCFILS